MRFGIGILSVLIAMALMLMLMVNTGYLRSVNTAQKQANTQINVISGYSADRKMLATDTVRYKVVNSGSKSKLIVTAIYRTGAMDERYGLRKDDQILEIGALDVAQMVTSKDDATAFLHDAYARNWPLVVMRNGQKLTLPTPEHVAEVAAKKKADALAAATQAAAAQQAPPPPAAYEPGALEKAMDSLWDR